MLYFSVTGSERPYDEILLTNEDFDVALNQYTPAGLRDVPLHSAGELGWEDVGGLKDVKQSLTETLELPAKVSFMFEQNHNFGILFPGNFAFRS